MKKELLNVIIPSGIFIVMIVILSFFLGREVKSNRELQKNNSEIKMKLNEGIVFKSKYDSLQRKYMLDSIAFVNKIEEVSSVVKIKYEIIKEGLDKMTPEQSIEYFYARTISKTPDSIEIKGDSSLVPNLSIKGANLLFVERDYYKEKSDTLDSAVKLARVALVSQIELSKVKDNVIENQNYKLNLIKGELNSLSDKNSKLTKKLKRNRKLAIISTTGFVSLIALEILL